MGVDPLTYEPPRPVAQPPCGGRKNRRENWLQDDRIMGRTTEAVNAARQPLYDLVHRHPGG